MIDEIWIDIFSDGDLVASEELKDVVSLMIEKRIDIIKFSGNLMQLITSTHMAPYDYLDGRTIPTTKTIEYFTLRTNRPPNVSLWFISAFPDVLKWFLELSWDESEKLLGITNNENEKSTDNKKGELGIKYLQNLVSSYQNITNNILETAVIENSEDDIYLGERLYNAMGEENFCTLAAKITTKYYVELKRNYLHSFPNEVALLATSGILDAKEYILGTKQIEPDQIIELAEKVQNNNNKFLDFVISLEVLLLSVDNPEMKEIDFSNICKEYSGDLFSFCICHELFQLKSKPDMEGLQ